MNPTAQVAHRAWPIEMSDKPFIVRSMNYYLKVMGYMSRYRNFEVRVTYEE